MFDELFEKAERFPLGSFTDVDVMRAGIVVPVLSEQDIATEGVITAVAGDAVRGVTDVWKEMKGWTLGIESKRRYINDILLDTIEWLKDEDRENKNLSLDMGKFKTWMKTSETFYWRYYFVLSDSVYNDIMSQIKKNEITTMESLADFDIKERMKVTKIIDSALKVKDLILLTDKYRARVNMIFDGLLKRKRRLQSFPFQIMLLGAADLNKTVKKVVNLAL
jgi:hypothetical protein